MPGGRRISGWIVAAGGVVVGLLAAIMGVGGGFVTFPMFVYIFGVSSMTTVGTDILQIIFTAGFAAVGQYAIYGYVFYTLAIGMLLGSLLGIQIGALTTKVVKGIHIRGFYAISIIAGFINRAATLPKKLVEMEVLFAVLLMPVMRDESGNHLTGLQYADNVFNELSKGSSYFIPGVRESVRKVDGKQVQTTVTLKKADLAPLAVALLQKAGVDAVADGGKVSFKGDLGLILTSATDDADALYHNDADGVTKKYDGQPALKVAAAWWYLLSPSIKELQKQHMISEAQVVDQVLRRAVEPGNNFYSVIPAKVSEHVWLMSGMLIFYVLYTLWYGFSIFELFEGLGLAMTKSKVKQES